MTYIPPLPNSMTLDDNAPSPYVVFSSHYDATPFADISSLPLTITSSSGVLDTTNKKFGAGSASFNGNTYVLYTGSKLHVTMQDFTFECWVRLTALSTGYQSFMYTGAGGTTGILLLLETNNRMTAYIGIGGGWDTTLQQGSDSTLGWHHVCLERYNNILTLYVDGVSVGTRTVAATYAVYQSSNDLYVGKYPNVSGVAGNVDEPIFLIGGALHKGAFSVPTQPYTIATGSLTNPVLGEMRQRTDGSIWLCTDAVANTWKRVPSYAYTAAS